jgi:Family of unknown function (DUF6221)
VDDLLEFLNARIGEDEAAAEQATPGPWEFEGDDPTDDELYTVHDGAGGDLTGQTVAWTRGRQVANGQHIARHCPARVLRQVEAMREILAVHAQLSSSIWCQTCDPGAAPFGGSDAWFPCKTVRVLASAWSDHPEWRQEWAPEERTAPGV